MAAEMGIGFQFEVTLSARWIGNRDDGIRGGAQWRTNADDPDQYELVVIVPGPYGESIGLIPAERLIEHPSFHAQGLNWRLDKKSVDDALVEMDHFLEHL